MSQKADGFQLLVDSGSSKHFIDLESICGVESRTPEYTRIEPPMEITAAGNNVLHGTSQGILLLVLVVRGTDDVLMAIKLSVVLVLGLKRNIFSTSAAAKKNVRTTNDSNSLSLDLGAFGVQLTRFGSMDCLDLTIAKESRRSESALCSISGNTFGKESVILTALVPMRGVTQSVGSTNVDQIVGENPLVEYKTRNEVSCEKIESNNLAPMISDADKEGKSSNISVCK